MANRILRDICYSIQWILLGTISILPTNLLRLTLLRLFGMKLGKTHIYSRFHIRKPSNVKIGDGTIIGHKVTLDGRLGLNIGKNVNISSEVMMWTMQHDYNDPSFGISGGKVTIEDYVWIATRALILPNVRIGEGAVIAAGSVVTKDVEPLTVVAGNPAKVIGKRNSQLDYDLKKLGTIPIV